MPPRPRWLAIVFMIVASTSLQAADDWPQWRFDATRSAASPHELPARLSLHYTLAGTPRTPVWDDPLNHDLMPYDQIFEPIVAHGLLLLPYNDRDKLVAYDLATGEKRWTFFADAPIRFAPVAHGSNVYVVSDDGHLVCLAAVTGEEQWRFSGAPSPRKALGNQRITSAWPARGGPVVRDGSVYFAASIWPFMGTFIYAIDAETGAVQWCNDSTSADYIKQPHNAPSFAGVAPQGALAATADTVIVPGGRSTPALLDRKTGDQRHFAFGGKGVGGSLVLADESSYYVHTRDRGVLAHELKSGKLTSFHVNEPVLHDGWVYTAGKETTLEAYDKKQKLVWKVSGVDATGDLIMSGNRLYAAGGGKLTAIELHKDRTKEPSIAWRLPLANDVARLLAADGHLVAVTRSGNVHVLGEADSRAAKVIAEQIVEQPARPRTLPDRVRRIVEQTGSSGGYALVFGLGRSQIADVLVEQSQYQIAVVENDPFNVAYLRTTWDDAGWYGTRITAHLGDPKQFQAPPYIAHLVAFDPKLLEADEQSAGTHLAAAYRSVRPYGGVLWLPANDAATAETLAKKVSSQLTNEQAEVEVSEADVLVFRRGPLKGAGTWTHQYGNAANSLMSSDSLVAAPLGVLWFGGNSNLDVLPRHGHGPPEQVIGGRLFIEGMNSLSARDVYTGRVIWKREFENLDNHGVYFDDSYRDAPLSTAYNQKHIYGANARGTNFVATADAVYLVIEDHCLVLDPVSGETVRTISLPDANAKADDDSRIEWGYIGVIGDVLLAGHGFANYGELVGDSNSRNSFISDLSASRGLIGFDRHTGKQLWSVKARHSFIHNAIAAGGEKVFVLDRMPYSVEERLRRRGKEKPDDYRILAIDSSSGEPIWEQTRDIFGSWLSYSAEHDLLLQAGAKASDRSPDETGKGLAVYKGADGKPVWQKLDLDYTGPCILHHETIITGTNSYKISAGAFSLLDGTQRTVRHPITGIEEPWKITRAYGCNYPIACENLLTFRSGAAGFYDLNGHSGSGNFGGFKSGCTSNLVAADGVLNAPDYTRTCSCAYQNQTSLALVHMPDLELWTGSKLSSPEGERIKQVGINLGAPGDRRAADGTLWLEYPVVGAESPELELKVEGDALSYFRRHASQIRDTAHDSLPWVTASGAEGISRLTLKLADGDTKRRGYRVVLYFREPEANVAMGDRVFDIAVQGKQVESRLDLSAKTASQWHGYRLETKAEIAELLTIELSPAEGSRLPPVLSGISVVLEASNEPK